MKRSCMTLLLCVLLYGCVGCLQGCGKQITPWEAMTCFAAAYPMPPGRMYNSMATMEQEEYLPPELYATLYSRADNTDDREDVRSCALFLGASLDSVYEVGIIECYDKDAAYEVIGTVKNRLKMLAGMPHVCTVTVADACIEIFGNTVVYTVLPDNAAAVRTLGRIFR